MKRSGIPVRFILLLGWERPVGCGGAPLDFNTMFVPLATRSATPHSSHPTAYWITSSAWKRSVAGMVRPSAAAVLRLRTSSNFVGCSTGRSPGLAPFKIRST